jgi:hypothetical protein
MIRAVGLAALTAILVYCVGAWTVAAFGEDQYGQRR